MAQRKKSPAKGRDRQPLEAAKSSAKRPAKGALSADKLLRLQRALGNDGTREALGTGILQPGPRADGSFEQEADHVADALAHRPSPEVPAAAATGSPESPDRDGGRALPAATRSFFELHMGRDFSDVRLHDDASADAAAQSMGARAFNVGRDIAFRRGELAPDTPRGRHLLAHELTHVAQRGLAPNLAAPAAGAAAVSLSAGAPPAGGAAAKVSANYDTIESNLTYGLFDWAIRDSEALGVLEILAPLNPKDLQDTVARMEADGYVSRLLENIAADEHSRFGSLIQSIQQARSTSSVTAHTESLLSYGLLDWAISDQEAHQALESLKSLRQTPARLKQVVTIIREKHFRRLFDELSDDDRKANKDFLAELQSLRETGLTRQDARVFFDAFKKLSEDERKKLFDRDYGSGRIRNVLRALSPQDAADVYESEVRQLLRWVQESATRAAAGMTDEQLAEAQAKHMDAENEALARKKIAEQEKKIEAEKAEKGLPKEEDKAPPAPPTPKQLKAAHQERVAKDTIKKKTEAEIEWTKKKDAEKKKWDERAKTAVSDVVALAKTAYPELNLTSANFRADFEGVERRGKRVLAHTGRAADGTRQVVFGYEFVRAALADPAYVMSVIVHELRGHDEFGHSSTSLLLALYDAAAAKVAGYTQPTDERRQEEIDNFAYQGTEIYSLLRSLPFHTSVRSEHADQKLASVDPKRTVRFRLKLIKKYWQPQVAAALARGLYVRFSFDPRLTPDALAAYKDGVKRVFAKEAESILK